MTQDYGLQSGGKRTSKWGRRQRSAKGKVSHRAEGKLWKRISSSWQLSRPLSAANRAQLRGRSQAPAGSFVQAHLCLVTARYHGTNPTQKLRNTSLVCISMKTGDLKGNLLIGGTAGERVKNSETAAKTGRAGILKNILSIIVIKAMVSETCSLT